MFKKLKNVEKSLKKLEALSVNSDLVKKMTRTLSQERILGYQNPTVLIGILKKSPEAKGLKKPTGLDKMTFLSEKENLLSTVDLNEIYYSSKFDVYLQNTISTYLRDLNIKVRLPEMKKTIIKEILNSKKAREDLLTNGQCSLNMPSDRSVSFAFTKEILSEQENETLTDILENFSAYKVHPDIGVEVLSKELDKLLEKHYNTYVFYLFEQENKYIEFTLN